MSGLKTRNTNLVLTNPDKYTVRLNLQWLLKSVSKMHLVTTT